MKSMQDILEARIAQALEAVSGQSPLPAMVRPAADPKFGDYQANGVMAVAKQIKTNPRQLAEKVVSQLQIDDLCLPPEIAGPGFINLRLRSEFLAERLLNSFSDTEHLGIDQAETPQTVVVDYSGPNIAKQMHVGHLRSTIIGDCICRLLEFQGHTVIRQNHIGDWGLQMGMLLAIAEELKKPLANQQEKDYRGTVYQPVANLEELEKLYKEASNRYSEDSNFSDLAKSWTVKLQNHDPIAKTQWHIFRKLTLDACNDIYRELNVHLSNENVRGESFYDTMLADVVKELRQKNLAVESEGAVCVFPEGFVNKEGSPLPFIIQKTDGAFLYATTDLAALRFRIHELKADKVIYVTDARQALHFRMLFETAKMAGWTDSRVDLTHVTFGTMLGEDNKPFKTRTGGTVKLKDLLEEAVGLARTVVETKSPDLSAHQKVDIARAVGIGAVKYSDYSNNRDSDYIFSFQRMLAMDGNTAPYMQYAYARIRSIERKAAGKDVDIEKELTGITSLHLEDPTERDLAKLLCQYDQVIEAAAAQCRPNYLTGYLYDLAQAFSRFYTACPVLDAGPGQRPTRLLLCDLTARTIRHGLADLLGIDTPEQM